MILNTGINWTITQNTGIKELMYREQYAFHQVAQTWAW